MTRTDRKRLLKIAGMALDASEKILLLSPTPPPTDADVDCGTKLAARAATIFAAIEADATVRLLRRAERREHEEDRAEVEEEVRKLNHW